MKAKITLETPATGLRPFGELRGRVTTAADKLPEGLELRMFWSTRGRGTEESEVVHRHEIGASAESGYSFRFELPKQPYSFSGALVSLVWAVELVDAEENGLALEEFILSPTGEELVLPKIDTPRSEKRKKSWGRSQG